MDFYVRLTKSKLAKSIMNISGANSMYVICSPQINQMSP